MHRLEANTQISRWTGNHPDGLEKIPDGLDNFQIVWKLSGWSGKLPNVLANFQMAWKVFRWFGKFPKTC